jgi:hypothetical protein
LSCSAGSGHLEAIAESFIERLNRGPGALLLGQQHFSLGATQDPLLDTIYKKVGAVQAGIPTYNVILGTAEANENGFLDWLDNRSKQFAVSEHLNAIAQHSWIGVWSSAIDSNWADAFESGSREVQKVFGDSYRPSDPRNRRRLHCTFLFGGISRSDLDERPPLNRLGYLSRKTVAQSLLRRVLSALGPTGTLAIEAYGPADWLPLDDLAGLVAQTQPGQCHLFSVSDELLATDEIRDLCASGLLVAHRRALGQILTEGREAGMLKVGLAEYGGDLQRLVSFDGQTHALPRDLWVSVASSAHVLDESLLSQPARLSPDANYAAFRRFLGTPEGRPDWEGIARGFAFERDFEANLKHMVERRASQRELSERPIVLHGATGTGKTTALCSLALSLAKTRLYPVMFVDRRGALSLDPSVIDGLCKWAEDEGARASVILWDGMLDVDGYESLARHFASRGRRVILVGSSYRQSDALAAHSTNLIAAPSELSASELERLSIFLGGFEERLAGLSKLASYDSTFLVFLYRLLPPARTSVRAGVLRELEQTERTIVERASLSAVQHEPRTALGWAMLESGLLSELQFDSVSNAGNPGEQFSVVEDFTSLTMVAAQFGLAVPLELILRATGRDGRANLSRLLTDIDLVRWIEDPAGNFLLGARSRLEAQLIARTRFGTLVTEIDYVRRLLLQVTDSDAALSGRAEVAFAIELLRALGAQGPNAERYLPEFRAIADALRELREEGGISNPRLMLQEANLLREWSTRQLRNQTSSEDARTQAQVSLAEATAVLRIAQDLAPGLQQKRLQNHLRVELCTNLATRAQALDAAEDVKLRAGLFAEARQVALAARSEDQGTYYPVDVLAWTTRDSLQSGILDELGSAEVIAEVLSAFELMDPSQLDASQAERYNSRRQEFAGFVGKTELADEAFEALLRAGSGAGVYLRARAMADISGRWQPISSSGEVNKIDRALRILDEYSEVVERDVRCLNLRLDLWWLQKSGQRPFGNERQCVAFDVSQWTRSLELLRPLEGLGTSYRDAQLMFLRGLAEFHLGDVSRAFNTFEDVERRSEEVHGRRRIERTYLASNPGGEPKLFSGTVSSVSNDGRRGEVYVESLRRRVTFRPTEFGGRTFERGSNIGEFHIAFNFLGIVADPPIYLKSRGSRGTET